MALDFLNTPVSDLVPSPRQNPTPPTPGRPGAPGRGGVRIPGVGGGIDILQEEVDPADALTPEQRLAYSKAKEQTRRLTEGLDTTRDDFTLKDLIGPLFFGGLTAAAGMGGSNALMAFGTALGAQEKKKNELRELDMKYNAAKKQRRFTNAMQAIEDMRKTPGMAAKAAALTVRVYEEQGFDTPSVEAVTKMFEAQDNKVRRKELEDEHLRLRNLGRYEEAEEFEYENWDVMQPDKELTPELRRRKIEETRRLLEKQGIEAKIVKKRMEKLELDYQNAVYQQEILKFNRSQLGQEKPKDRFAARNNVRRAIDNAVLATIRKDLDPASGTMLDEAIAQTTGPDGQQDSGRALNVFQMMQANEAKKKGSKAKPDQRLFATAEHYVSAWNNIKKTDLLNVLNGTPLTAQEVFPEEFILSAMPPEEVPMTPLQPGFQGPGDHPSEPPSLGQQGPAAPEAPPATTPPTSNSGGQSDIMANGGPPDSSKVRGRIPPATDTNGNPVDPRTGEPLTPQPPTHTDPERAAEITEELIELSQIQRENGSLTPSQAKRAQKLATELAQLRVQ